MLCCLLPSLVNVTRVVFLRLFVGFINVARRSVGRGSGTRVADESVAVLVLDSGVSQPGVFSEVLTGSVLV